MYLLLWEVQRINIYIFTRDEDKRNGGRERWLLARIGGIGSMSKRQLAIHLFHRIIHEMLHPSTTFKPEFFRFRVVWQ